MHRLLLTILLCFCCSITAAPISDTLPFSGYYRQQGKKFSRRKVEKFLRNQDSSAELAGRSRAYRLTAGGIGATMGAINLGITIYQITSLIKEIEQQVPVSIPLNDLSTMLSIGAEITSIAQGYLRNHSDFLLHKAALEYNRQLFRKLFPDSLFDYRIEKQHYGWYRQDRLEMPEHVLYSTLRENEPSRIAANWSIAFREVAQPAYVVGGLFIFYLLSGLLDPHRDIRTRNQQLGWGIGLTGFGIINSIVSAVIRNRAIDIYNHNLPVDEEEPGIKESVR